MSPSSPLLNSPGYHFSLKEKGDLWLLLHNKSKSCETVQNKCPYFFPPGVMCLHYLLLTEKNDYFFVNGKNHYARNI